MLNNISYIHRYMMGQLRRIYFMALPESKEDFKRSRIFYTTADSATQTIAQLSGGTFLAALMTYCNISDANIGIVSSLLSCAALSQLFMVNFFKRLKKYKLLVCVTSLQRLLFAFIFFIPLFSLGGSLQAFLIIALYFIGQIFVQIGSPASQDWIASLVPGRLRGKYFAIKDSIAVFIVSSTMLIAGMILDFYKARNILIGFIIVGSMIFILTLINVIALSKMKEPKTSYINEAGKEMHGRLAKKAKIIEKETCEKGQGILSELKGAFADYRFRKAFLVQCLYIFAFYICIPFNASYQINELSLPYTFIMLISFVFNLYRIYITPRFGRLADKYGMAKLLRFTLLALGLNFLTTAFTIPANAYPLFIVGTILNSTAWAFVGIGLFGIQLDFFRTEKRMVWLTITSSLTGFLGFLVSILGGAILDYLQKLDLHIFGIKIYAQQVLNLIGFLIILITVYYIKFHIETEKIAVNRKDGRM